MNYRLTNVLLLLGLFTMLISCKQKAPQATTDIPELPTNLKEDEEPPLIFEVSSGSTIQYVVQNQPQVLAEMPVDKPVTIKVYEWKMFPFGGMQFEYPSSFTFESSFGDHQKIWTLSGNDLKYKIFEPENSISIQEFTDTMVSKFGKENCETKAINNEINGHQLQGIDLKINIGGSLLNMTTYEVKHENGINSLLIIQDSLTDTGEHSEEYAEGMEKLNETFEIN